MPMKSRAKTLVTPDKAQVGAMLRDNALLCNLTPAQWEQFLSYGHIRQVSANTTVLWHGRAAQAVFIILGGTVKVFYTSRDRADAILAVCGAGELLGEISAVDGEPISANVATLETSLFWVIERDDFLHCLRTTPEMSLNLVRCTMRRLRTLSSHVQLLSHLNTTGRVAAQLLNFAAQYGVRLEGECFEDKGETPIFLPLRLRQSDLSDLVGASRVRVNQILNIFRRSGIISLDNQRHITICQPDKLAQLCR